jgi:uncharacterized hydrophobic protein (TIGR00271 family)
MPTVKQVVIILPEFAQNVGEVEHWLTTNKSHVMYTKIHAESEFIIQFTVLESDVNEMLGGLKTLLSNAPHQISILPIETHRPKLDIGEAKSERFSQGIESRKTTEAIMDAVDGNVTLSFDFNLLLISASVIAAAGLATDNPVVVVASMLVSPLMGPIVGFCFGFVTRDWDLVRVGVINECIALALSLGYGFLCGFLFLGFAGDLDFVTNEMGSRGEPSALLIGILVAAPSGVGVALSVTSTNVGALIGVAISASLLPPAVNAGLLWNYGLFGPLIRDDVDRVDVCIKGAISFALVIENILVIFITSVFTFWIKRITPMGSRIDYYELVSNFRKEKVLSDTYAQYTPSGAGSALNMHTLVSDADIGRASDVDDDEI